MAVINVFSVLYAVLEISLTFKFLMLCRLCTAVISQRGAAEQNMFALICYCVG